MHSHPAKCAIYLTGGTTRITSEAGEVTTVTRVPGQVECRGAEVHRSENVGTKAQEVVILEMKGRDNLR
jgi:hypothetical protein